MSDNRPRILRPEIDPGRRILVISDVHGNLPYLRGVLEKARFGGSDLVIFDGDFVEKGAQSLATLRFVMELCESGRALAVCGNCDDWARIFSATEEQDRRLRHFLALRRPGLIPDMCAETGLDPLEGDFSAFKTAIRRAFPAEWAFLEKLPHAVDTDDILFVHAGLRAGKPLEEHRIGELVKDDEFVARGESFDKWVVVGHHPVVLYGTDIVDADPVIDRERHIVSIDGGCVLKDDGQLNALILPGIRSRDFSWVSYDPFPPARVLRDQPGGGRSYYIRWGDSTVRVLRRGEEFSLCRHVRTGYEMEILTKYLFSDDEVTGCNDCTDYALPLRAGDTVRIVETTSRGFFVKHGGVSGWYDGPLERL